MVKELTLQKDTIVSDKKEEEGQKPKVHGQATCPGRRCLEHTCCYEADRNIMYKTGLECTFTWTNQEHDKYSVECSDGL